MLPAKILIVKTSSLGDIIQSLNVLDDLKSRFPQVEIDWVVEKKFESVVSAHPHVSKVISFNKWWDAIQKLRQENYDVIFDLQGNCKSGILTLLARGKVKVGYGLKVVREWPNVLATGVRFNISRGQNIRAYYLGLIEAYFQSPTQEIKGVRFKTGDDVQGILKKVSSPYRIMVCPGSKWANKQLKPETWIDFLRKIEGASFLFMWGDAEEKALCQKLAGALKEAIVVDKLSIPTWQNLMSEVDLVIAVDSSALHLCGTTNTPSFSIFGPTSPDVFKPLGSQHCAIQGKCPYGKTFQKQCPILRTCPTGACIKNLTAEELFAAFQSRHTVQQF